MPRSIIFSYWIPKTEGAGDGNGTLGAAAEPHELEPCRPVPHVGQRTSIVRSAVIANLLALMNFC